MSDWYYMDGSEQQGPIPMSKLRGLLDRGVVARQAQVREAQSGTWLAASEVAALTDEEACALTSTVDQEQAKVRPKDLPNTLTRIIHEGVGRTMRA